jgi:hypothetical protein
MLKYQNKFLVSMKSEKTPMPPLISCHPIIFAATAVAIGTISFMGWARLLKNPGGNKQKDSKHRRLVNQPS